ncbi:unnamed protein product [Rhodiola kirilowii]
MTATTQIDPPKTRKKQNITASLLQNINHSFINPLSQKLEPLNKIVTQKLAQFGLRDSSKRTRVYHLWPGKNVFFFHGRLICGPDPKGLILTSTSIILSTWIFTVYSPFDDFTFISIFSLILTSLVFVNMILVSGIDPGIIPRARRGDIQRTDSSRGARKSRTVVVNGVALKSKYCKVCNIFRPPRSSHCAICDNCVQKFDHHCPWLGQCIGLRNYRFYLAFILSSLVFFGYILTFSCWRIHKRIQTSGTGFIGLIKNWPETMALATFSFAAAWFSLGLSGLHLYLVAINQTGYEKFRQRYATSGNPFNKGILSNVKEALFSPMPPSAVDFRGEVSDGDTLV